MTSSVQIARLVVLFVILLLVILAFFSLSDNNFCKCAGQFARSFLLGFFIAYFVLLVYYAYLVGKYPLPTHLVGNNQAIEKYYQEKCW